MESGGSSGITEKYLVVPDRTVAFKDVHGVALVGKMVDLEPLLDFDRLLKIAGTEYVRLQYLGGLSILISFKDEESAKRFLDAKAIWVRGFPNLTLGLVLYVPKLLEEDQDLSMSRMGILVGESFRIREVVSLKWKNRCYRVMVEEEEEFWVPDCLKSSVEISSGEDSPLQSSPVSHFPVDQLEEAEKVRKLDSQEGGRGSGTENSKGGSGKGDSLDNMTGGFVSFGPEVGSSSNMMGEEPNKIFFFHSKKRSRRCRRRSGKTHSSPKNLDHGSFLDSVEKVRPNKRSRAQFSGDVEGLSFNGASDPVSSDPFSLNRLLDLCNKNRDILGEAQFPISVDKDAPPSVRGRRRGRCW
ncbi:hypothetical protein HanRHA438_Chr03g0105741 [Helianthus annuus]|nr:hypothetical protein HanIR_Chr03g0103281 [Helianthus annuus]KAJ0772826.1 hypothetical protein HanOQP8_Chr03g0091881 [Helianthus annuus]KAJ0934290.1 hypothetical protein HanRHA438_Chr03g0105741 [Helianthus annuus]KAJ0942366.1 hypothetical protein HanPSC8_Chr03g0091121 [Helianthus annuus]